MALVRELASLRHKSIGCSGVVSYFIAPALLMSLACLGICRSRLFPGEAWLLRIDAMLLLGGFLQ